jgi:hypothetical protein
MANLLVAEPKTTGETVTIEADTVELALARLAQEVGPGAKILAANRVRRGGMAGFFAREAIELVAEIAPPATGGVDSAFARMLAVADQVGQPREPDPIPHRSTPADPLTPPASALLPGSPHGVRWNSETMLDIGLPTTIVNRLAHLDADDDLGHVMTLASVLANLCGPLPDEPLQTIGVASSRFKVETGGADGAGPIHLVVGSEAPAVLDRAPAVVSWASDTGAAHAIAIALATGATLGYGGTVAIGQAGRFGPQVVRVTPMDAALVIRSHMGRA